MTRESAFCIAKRQNPMFDDNDLKNGCFFSRGKLVGWVDNRWNNEPHWSFEKSDITCIVYLNGDTETREIVKHIH